MRCIPISTSTLRIQCLTLCLAEVSCGPVQQRCFIAHLRIQLSAAILIIDAAFCDFQVEEKASFCFQIEGLKCIFSSSPI